MSHHLTPVDPIRVVAAPGALPPDELLTLVVEAFSALSELSHFVSAAGHHHPPHDPTCDSHGRIGLRQLRAGLAPVIAPYGRSLCGPPAFSMRTPMGLGVWMRLTRTLASGTPTAMPSAPTTTVSGTGLSRTRPPPSLTAAWPLLTLVRSPRLIGVRDQRDPHPGASPIGSGELPEPEQPEIGNGRAE